MWFLWPPLFCIQVGFILWNFFHSWALPICLKVMESNSYDQMTRCQSSTIQYNILWPKWNITVSIIVPLMVDSYKPTWNAMWAVECIGLVNGLIGNNIKLGRDLMWYTIFFLVFIIFANCLILALHTGNRFHLVLSRIRFLRIYLYYLLKCPTFLVSTLLPVCTSCLPQLYYHSYTTSLPTML